MVALPDMNPLHQQPETSIALDPPAILRDATRTVHAAVERHSLLRCLMRGPARIADYALTLQALHAYVEPVEIRLCCALERRGPIFPDYRYIPRAPLLERDLADLGRSCRRIEPIRLPPTDTPGHAFGVLYVLEGSSQGGRVLGPVLARRFGVTSSDGGRYFSVHGDRQAQWWAACRDLLREAARQGTPIGDMVTGARETFATLHAHLDTCRHEWTVNET